MNHKGRPRPHPAVRIDHERCALTTRQLIAAHAQRHPNLVSRYCQPIACDTESKALLYPFDEAVATLAQVPSRRVA